MLVLMTIDGKNRSRDWALNSWRY